MSNNNLEENNIKTSHNELNVFDLWQVIWKWKVMIITITLLAAILSVVYVKMKPNLYRAEALLAPVGDTGKKGGARSIFREFGNLASFAGVSPKSSSTEVNLAILTSSTFLEKLIKENNLLESLFPPDAVSETDDKKKPTLWGGYRRLKGSISVSTDKKSILTKVSLVSKDPEEAAKLLKLVLVSLNDYLKNEAIEESQSNIDYLKAELEKTSLIEMRNMLYAVIADQTKQIMLAKSKRDFAFKIIDPPKMPQRKFRPRRAYTVIISTAGAFFLSILLAFSLEVFGKHKRDSLRMNEVR